MDKKLSSSLEDYLEAIYTLCLSEDAANANKIAQMLDVKKSSVSWALKQLSEKDLINYSSYAPITLTDKGEIRARQVYARHQAIRNYLVEKLMIDPEVAEENACRMEHVIDPEVLEKMVASMDCQAQRLSSSELPKESERGERDLPSRVIDILTECGTKLTDRQQKIIKVFMCSDLHHSLESLVQECKTVAPDVSDSQVQAVIDILCEHRFAEPLYVGGKVVYEHLHPESHHDHYYCVKCGGIIEFYDPRLEYFQDESARQANFKVLDHHLIIKGVCSECLEKESATRTLNDCLEGERLKVVRVNNKCERERILGMGLMPGVEFEVVADGRSGNMILLLRSSRITIDTDLAGCVKVTSVSAQPVCRQRRGYHRHKTDRNWGWPAWGRKKQ